MNGNNRTVEADSLNQLASVSDGSSLLVTGPSSGRVSVAKLREAILGEISLAAVMDGVFIMYHGNTAQIIAHSTSSAVNNTAAYAPGFCNLYSHGGLGAGKWWLPSAGELMMIYANMTKINYALSLISGATQFAETWYWSSTENSATLAWTLTLTTGILNCTNKASLKGRVRPVSAFIS